MEETETLKVELETPLEEETKQPEEVRTQPTAEELLSKVNELTQEIDRKEKVITQTKRELRQALNRGGSVAEIASLKQEISSMQDWIASAMDDLATRVSGEYEQPQPQRKSYREQLQENRASQPRQEKDPVAQRFFDYLDDEGLDFNDDKVQEAIKDTRTPQESLKAVKDMVKNMEKAEIEKLAEQKAEEKLQMALEKRLKDLGLTTGGVSSPTGGSGRNFTNEQIKAMSPEEFKKNREAIMEAQRQGRIK